MTPERFMSLIETYGAEPARWPVEWRADAEASMLGGDAAIVSALAQARALDAELSRHWIEPPDVDLVRRITASAPVPPGGAGWSAYTVVAFRCDPRRGGAWWRRGRCARHLVDHAGVDGCDRQRRTSIERRHRVRRSRHGRSRAVSAMPARPSRLFIASLVLNVFLVGAMAGGAYRWATERPAAAAAAASRPQGLRAAAAELSEGRQAQLRGALQHTRRENRPLILEGRAGRLDVLHALRAQPFDAAALDAALTRTRTADVALRAQLEQSIAQFAADLTPEERVKLIDAMESRGMLRRVEAVKNAARE